MLNRIVGNRPTEFVNSVNTNSVSPLAVELVIKFSVLLSSEIEFAIAFVLCVHTVTNALPECGFVLWQTYKHFLMRIRQLHL